MTANNGREELLRSAVEHRRSELEGWAKSHIMQAMRTMEADAVSERDPIDSIRAALVNALFDGWTRGVYDYQKALMEIHGK